MDKQVENAGWKIAAVERETGLGKDTLRVWERRYGFPMPTRDSLGERCYSSAELDKLRVVKRLLDTGRRPAALMPLSIEELQQLAGQGDAAPRVEPADAVRADVRALLELLRSNDLATLRRRLGQALAQMGLTAFVIEIVAPLNTQVGETWVRGQLNVFQEHSYAEVVQGMLRSAIQGLVAQSDQQTPRVLLGTLPGEAHGLGLLMAEAMFAAEGAFCHSLGVQTPASDLVLAASAYRVDILALSFSACMGVNQVLDGLADLRRTLPPAVELWAGGSSPALRRRAVAARVLHTLDEVPEALRQWRAAHAPAAA